MTDSKEHRARNIKGRLIKREAGSLASGLFFISTKSSLTQVKPYICIYILSKNLLVDIKKAGLSLDKKFAYLNCEVIHSYFFISDLHISANTRLFALTRINQ